MPTAAGGVDHGQREQRPLRILCAQRLGDQRIERFGEHQVDQLGRGVVGAGGFAFVTGGKVEGEGAFVGVVAGGVGQQPLIHAAEFFAVEVAVVDAAGGAGDRVVDLGERADRGQKRAVGEPRPVEDAQIIVAEEGGAEPAEPELGQSVAGERVGDDLVGFP